MLIGKGYQVWLPQLPGSDRPNAEKYTDFLLANENFKFDEETILIGHSSGAVEILHLLQNLPKGSKVAGAVLVSAFRDNLDWDILEGLFTTPFDFEKIKSHCAKFVFVHSDNDPYCPLAHAEYLSEQTGGDLLVYEGQGHFNTEASPYYKHFPELLEIIDSF